ncbi:response regulator transcription factor [Treponema pectinovorum]|uniref:response regulator transcription factor n=1 Tax=Treponema pectinovorum TaxID=164 RepID=UPI001659F4B7|nr:response regulator transcription factor [Treponema pectinovorum]
MKNLILIDDHKMLRKGISAYFTENSKWNVIAEAESLDEIPNIIKKIKENPYIMEKNDGERVQDISKYPDSDDEENYTLAVVDIQIKGKDEKLSNGFEAVRLLRHYGIQSVIFSSHDTGACIERAMSDEVGARGFVSKLSDEKLLLDAVNTVAEGKTFIQPDLVTSLLNTQSIFSILTKREKQIVKLIQDGLSNHQIAQRLEIKVSTLENYLSVIYDKIGCKNKEMLLKKLS